jgi:hypothetical protein
MAQHDCSDPARRSTRRADAIPLATAQDDERVRARSLRVRSILNADTPLQPTAGLGHGSNSASRILSPSSQAGPAPDETPSFLPIAASDHGSNTAPSVLEWPDAILTHAFWDQRLRNLRVHGLSLTAVVNCLGLKPSNKNGRGKLGFADVHVQALNEAITSITNRLPKSSNSLLDVASEPEKLREEVEGLMEEFGEIWEDGKDRGLRYRDEGEREM